MDDHDTGCERGNGGGSGNASGAPTDGCSCCDSLDAEFEYFATKLRLESEGKLIEPDGETGVLDAELPEELQSALGQFLDAGPVQTLGDWVAEVRERTGGGSIDIEDLCHDQADTRHWGELEGERYHFTCFFDAVVLAALTDERVEIRTESPEGTTIEATVTGDGDLEVDPPGTLVSFGVATTPDAIPDGEPTREDVYGAVCPVVNAFPSPQAYERWSEVVPAATVAMPLEDATAVATAIAK